RHRSPQRDRGARGARGGADPRARGGARRTARAHHARARRRTGGDGQGGGRPGAGAVARATARPHEWSGGQAAMSEILTNDQIAALVEAAKQGELPEEPSGRRGRRLRTVDFSRPTKFTSEQERRITRTL